MAKPRAQMTRRERAANAAADAHSRRKRLKGGQHATTRGQMRAVIRQVAAERGRFLPR